MTEFSAPSNLQTQLPQIQILRAFAVLLVALAHSSSQIDAPKLFQPEVGHFGVDIFFVISGFIMVLITEKKTVSAGRFIINRMTRIIPVYWFYSFALLVITLAMPSMLRGTEFSISHIVLSLGFFPHENPATGSFSPFLRLGWTLNMEMMFYCVFAVAMLVKFSQRTLVACGFLVALVVYGYVFRWLNYEMSAPMEFWSSDLVLEFVAGMVLSMLFVRGSLPKTGTLGALLIIILSLFVAYIFSEAAVTTDFRGVIWGIPAVLIVYSSLSLAVREPISYVEKVLIKLGDASYTIYLSHIFFFTFLRVIWQKAEFPEGSYAAQASFQIVSIILAFWGGYCAYKLIELPLTAAVRNTVNNFSRKAI